MAFKQSYFSAILHPSNPFPKKGTKFYIENFKEGHPQAWTHLNGYHATMALDFQNNAASFNWFFGPNDYEVLKSYGSGYDDILNFGWGLFRWINSITLTSYSGQLCKSIAAHLIRRSRC